MRAILDDMLVRDTINLRVCHSVEKATENASGEMPLQLDSLKVEPSSTPSPCDTADHLAISRPYPYRIRQWPELHLSNENNPLHSSTIDPDSVYTHICTGALVLYRLINNSTGNMKVKILSYHAVAAWRWDMPEDDDCGICRVQFDGTCPKCKFPGDDCPISMCPPW
jgi:hypothetical protein